jgi:hypothetical protein
MLAVVWCLANTENLFDACMVIFHALLHRAGHNYIQCNTHATCALSRMMSSSTSVLEGRYSIPHGRPIDSCATVVVFWGSCVTGFTRLRVMDAELSHELPTLQLQCNVGDMPRMAFFCRVTM